MPAQVRVDRLKPIYSAAKGLNFGFQMRAFPDAPAHNGVAAYQPQLLRLTIRVWEFLFFYLLITARTVTAIISLRLQASQTLDLPLFNL